MNVTECPQGHAYSGANVYTDRTGRRHCVTCRNARKRAKRAHERSLRDLRPAWLRGLPSSTDGQTLRIPLSGGKAFALIDATDLHLISERSWQFDTHGYAKSERTVNGRRQKLYMHRVILGACAGEEVDHANRNRLDNRRANLRVADRTQQNANSSRRSDNTSGYRGVSFTSSNAWGAWIGIRGKSTNLGTFADPVSAAKAYDDAARLP